MTMTTHFHSQRLPIILLLFLLSAHAHMILEAAAVELDEKQPITLVGCPDKCGNISIPYPFGMKPGCFHEGFQVTCIDSFNPHRAYLAYGGVFQRIMKIHDRFEAGSYHRYIWTKTLALELIDISVAKGEARAYAAVSSKCSPNRSDYLFKGLQMLLGEKMSPFLLSARRNALIGVGWRVHPMISSDLWSVPTLNASPLLASSPNASNKFSLSCLSDLMGKQFLKFATNGSCLGRGCCQAAFPEEFPVPEFSLWFNSEPPNTMFETNPCSYGMVVVSSWYNFSTPDMYGYEVLPKRFPRGVPFVIDFSIRNGSCPTKGQLPPPDYACVSGNSSCANASSGQGYVCKCWDHYDGNPYITNGCQDNDECKLRKLNPQLRDLYPCSSDGICKNTLGGYDCPCKPGMKGDGIKGTCTGKFPLAEKVILGT